MAIGALIAITLAAAATGEIKVLPAERDEQGFQSYSVECEYQHAATLVKVLTPDKLESGRRYPVLYVLPVEPGTESRYGHGLAEVKRHDLHNRFGLICVLPTFTRLPWYADHPTDEKLRQETYLLKVVLPLIERELPALPTAEGRLLLGFSKSGYGAWSLLARHPDLFSRAAAWDAPVNMDSPSRFGMGEIYGTQENFEDYRLNRILETGSKPLASQPRLALLGYGSFRDQHVAMHEKLAEWHIPHEYRDGPQRKHVWESGWVPEAVQWLVQGGS